MRLSRERWVVRGLTALALTVALAGPAGAARTEVFRAQEPGGLLRGKLDGMSLAADGALSPAPFHERLFAGEVSYVWSLVPDGQGGAYAATGSEGGLYHIPAGGSPTRVATTLEYELFALTPGPGEGLYFAGAPNGTVTFWAPGEETHTVIDLPEGLVWDLLRTPSGDLYAASGEGGELYRIAEDGTTRPFGRVPDNHVVVLAWWGERLICGTDGRGLLVAFDPEDGSSEVLYDTAQEEIVALLPLGDRLLFAANGREPGAGEESSDLLTLPVVEVRPEGLAGAPTLYELDAAGEIRAVWHSPEAHILSLCEAPGGRVLVGTGNDGMLFALDTQWTATRLADLDEADLLAMTRSGDRVYVGTGNAGAIYRFDWHARREGLYTSRVWDAGRPSSWGTPHWVATGAGEIVFESRSGQTGEPDESWSDWVARRGRAIASPAARFLQWRMRLQAGAQEGLRVREVSIPYRGPNRAPIVSRIDVSAQRGDYRAAGNGISPSVQQELPGGVRVEYTLTEPPANGQPLARPGLWARTLRSASWHTLDPDGDQLRYDLYLRPVEEEGWLPLELDLEESAWSWESAAWPDGWYELRVVARDDLDNPPGEGRRTERVSGVFVIDNTPPVLEDVRLERTAQGVILRGAVRDAQSRIARLEISRDGAGWEPVAPADGILDDLEEVLEVAIRPFAQERWPSVVGVRATDENGHLASARARLPRP